MADSPKPFTCSQLSKSPSLSRIPSSTTTSKSDQQYAPVNREWAAPAELGYSQYHSPYGSGGAMTMPDQRDAQFWDPMERWEREDLRQSSWNNVASHATSSHSMDCLSSQKTKGQEDNWSMTGNAQSEK